MEVKFWNRWFCKHAFVWFRNIYGDEINAVNARSVWKCSRCGKYQYRGNLHYEGEQHGK